MVGAASDAYNYTGVWKAIPIFVPDSRNCDPTLYQMAEVGTHTYTRAQKLRPIRAAPLYQEFLGSEPPGISMSLLGYRLVYPVAFYGKL